MGSEQLPEIKEGALFVADSHYPHHGDAFLLLLKKLESGDLVAPQLFLMGDNFDLLFGYNDYIRTFSSEAIALLQRLSQRIEIHYFEGNHDFLLKEIFTNIKIYPRASQPRFFRLGKQRVVLSHGDRYGQGFGYELYCKVIRNRYLLTLLRPFGKWIINDRMAKLKRKSICRPMKHFEQRVEQIVSFYDDAELIVEGHYHQSRVIGNYISLPSLACQKEVAVARDGMIYFVALENLRIP